MRTTQRTRLRSFSQSGAPDQIRRALGFVVSSPLRKLKSGESGQLSTDCSDFRRCFYGFHSAARAEKSAACNSKLPKFRRARGALLLPEGAERVSRAAARLCEGPRSLPTRAPAPAGPENHGERTPGRSHAPCRGGRLFLERPVAALACRPASYDALKGHPNMPGPSERVASSWGAPGLDVLMGQTADWNWVNSRRQWSHWAHGQNPKLRCRLRAGSTVRRKRVHSLRQRKVPDFNLPF